MTHQPQDPFSPYDPQGSFPNPGPLPPEQPADHRGYADAQGAPYGNPTTPAPSHDPAWAATRDAADAYGHSAQPQPTVAAAGGAGTATAVRAPGTAPTDARAGRRGSPIIAPGIQPAALTAALAALLALAAPLGRPALGCAVALLQAVTAAGWFRLNGMWPARQGIALAFAGGLVADGALLAADTDHAPAAVVGALGVWCLLVLVLQLRNHSAADERLYALTATVTSTVVTVLAAGLLAAAPDAVVVGAPAVAAAALSRALPLPRFVSPVVALLAAAGAGIAVGGPTDLGPWAALLGLAAGGCALIGLRVASYDFPSRFVHMTAGVALPLTAAAPALYLIGRVIG